jgi:hypothetical protein
MSEMTDAPEQGGLRPTSDDTLDKMPQAQRLRWLARATHRALAGSRRLQSEADWEKLLAEAHEEYDSGAFLLERLGAERYLDPKLMATLLTRRQSIIAEWGITAAAETMLVDQAVVHYALALRVQGWIGDLAVRIEHEFFGDDAFTEMVKGQRRVADRFAVAERVQRLGEQLMPILDRANRMMIRNLKAIKELRQGQVPAIAIGRAEQATVTNRPPRRLRPLKGEAPQPDVATAAITSGSDARSAATESCWLHLATAVRANVGGRSRDRRKRLPGAGPDYAPRGSVSPAHSLRDLAGSKRAASRPRATRLASSAAATLTRSVKQKCGK